MFLTTAGNQKCLLLKSDRHAVICQRFDVDPRDMRPGQEMTVSGIGDTRQNVYPGADGKFQDP